MDNKIDRTVRVNHAYLAGMLEGKLRSMVWNGELEKLESMNAELRDAVINSWINEAYVKAGEYAK